MFTQGATRTEGWFHNMLCMQGLLASVADQGALDWVRRGSRSEHETRAEAGGNTGLREAAALGGVIAVWVSARDDVVPWSSCGGMR